MNRRIPPAKSEAADSLGMRPGQRIPSSNAVASYLGFGTIQFSGSLRVNDPFLGALCPSKSGLMNKHIVKHIKI